MNKTNHFPKWRQTSAKVLMPGLVLAGITSCQLRDIVPYDDQAHISIDVDWSLMDQDPTGMTVMFYPTDGGRPYKHVTNEVHHVEVNLPEKDYDVLVFNQTMEEFETIKFRGMDMFNTAEAYAPESTDTDGRIDRLYKKGGRGYNSSGMMKPKSLGSATTSINKTTASNDNTRGYNSSGMMKPKPNVGQLSATIHVLGLNNAIAVNGALTGLSSGVFFGSDQMSTESLTQEIDNWDVAKNEENQIGTISAVFGTFGLSPNIDYGSSSRAETGMIYMESSEDDDYRNILYLNFLLSNYTYVSYRFDVTDNIQDYTADAEVELVLDLGTDIQEYLELPQSGLPYSDTPVSVTQWGDTIIHNITF